MIEVLLVNLIPITGLLVGGEAFALTLGVFVIKKGKSPWNTLKNRSYLYADLFAGSVLLVEHALGIHLWYLVLAFAVIAFSILMHYRRVVEYVMKKPNAFCGNKALFLVNNLKLVLLFGLLFTVIPF